MIELLVTHKVRALHIEERADADGLDEQTMQGLGEVTAYNPLFTSSMIASFFSKSRFDSCVCRPDGKY